jgi:hypothetical protein
MALTSDQIAKLYAVRPDVQKNVLSSKENSGKQANRASRWYSRYLSGGGADLLGGTATASAPSLVAPDTSQLKALQGQYQNVLTPSAGETETSTQLQNVITSKELGIAKAEQEPMAQGFVTGQSTALEKSAALKSMPLQTKLANLQAQRTAAADVLKASLGFETERVDRETASYESTLARQAAEREAQTEREFTASENKKARKAAEKQAKKERKSSKEQFEFEKYKYEDSKKSKGSSSSDKRDKSFESDAKSLANDVKKGNISREDAKEVLKRRYSDYDENVIYDLVPDNWKVKK